MLEAVGLECVRGQRRLFHRLSFELPPGHALWVLGPNGSGKTSLLRMLCGLLRPEAGRISWKGEDVRGSADSFHADLLYLGHAPAVKEDLCALENVRFGLAQVGIDVTPHEARAALSEFGLAGREELLTRSLSLGQRRRVGLARLTVGAAKALWILDEPFTALDAQAVELVQSHLTRHVRRGGSVVFASHHEVGFAELPLQRLQLAQ
ncbi:MAG TPA: cytochrome c biogenesis heme-transporting ATPase CcmA [Burkholderiales bacterium]|nr:cytochrome c biogenesis heme-transporting ATPase CcmA [Burkholderiales bacterium]